MTPTQRNYQIYDKEFLAIINALSEWRQYLLGAVKTFEIITDHRNLEYYRKPQNLSCRQADWVSQLSEYDFLLLHRPGRLHDKADFLSRPFLKDKGGDDNKNVIGIPDERWSSIPSVTTPPLIMNALYIADSTDQTQIIARHHDGPLAGHPGIDKTIDTVQCHFHWDTLRQDVTEYVKGCTACQRNKPHRYKPKAPLHPVDPGSIPFVNISVDLISPLPLSNEYDSILVFVDKTTKKAIFVPTSSTLTSLDYASLFVSHWI
jgi:Integrase zinc binding domain/RNase H-like domain found in reverse transcriptase